MKNEKVAPVHDKFKLGQGYGSAEKGSEFQEKLEDDAKEEAQFGDNPLPPSGGGYAEADEAQPDLEEEDLDENNKTKKLGKMKPPINNRTH